MKRKAILAGAALLAAVAAGLGFYWPFGEQADVLRLPGVVEIQEVRLGSKIGGRVEKVEVQEGDLVQAEQPLVYFEVPELKAQHAQLQARLAAAAADLQKAEYGPRKEEIEAAKAAMDAARARYERVKAGYRVEEIRQARNELASAEAEQKQALDDFERVEQVYRQRSASKAEYDAAVAARDRARARVNAAQAKYEMLEKGHRPEDKAEAEAEWQRTVAQYNEMKAGTRQEDIDAARARLAETRAKLAEVEVNLQEAVVRAPSQAVVEVLAVRKGDIVAPNQPVARVLRAEDMWVRVYVPETELGQVRLHQRVEVMIDSYPGKRFEGEVIQINTMSEFTPRNVQSPDERRHQVFGVKVRIKNAQEAFHAGMAAEVLLPLHPAP